MLVQLGGVGHIGNYEIEFVALEDIVQAGGVFHYLNPVAGFLQCGLKLEIPYHRRARIPARVGQDERVLRPDLGRPKPHDQRQFVAAGQRY